jgi:hypothetical protein
MMSLKVTWTFLSTPHVTTMVSDNCAVGPGGERSEVWESGVGEGSECENLGTKTPKPETPKPRNPEKNLDDGKTTVDFILWRMSKRGPLIHPIS